MRFFQGRRLLAVLLVLMAAGFAVADDRENPRLTILARLADGIAPRNVAASYGMTVLDVTPGGPFVLFGVPSEDWGDAAEDAMREDPRVLWAEDNLEFEHPESLAKMKASKGGTLPAIGGRGTLQNLNATYLAQIGWHFLVANTGGRPVRVALLDTGIAPQLSYLWSKVDASMNTIEVGQPALDQAQGMDTNLDGVLDGATGHGSMVAGLVDAVAPRTRFIVARIADSDGVATFWDVIKGMTFAVARGAEVINISLGTPNELGAMGNVLDWVEERGAVVVSAVGNANTEGAFYPARFESVIGVAGLTAANQKAPFSNWDQQVLVSAPAVNLVSQFAGGELASWSGTSFAAPLVSAAIADCLRRTPRRLSPLAIREAVYASGRDLNALNPAFRGELGRRLDLMRLNALLTRRPR